MKLKDIENIRKIKFWVGFVGTIIFGFTTFMALLKGGYESFKTMGEIGLSLSELVGRLIYFIYSYTEFLPFFWSVIWEQLPIIELRDFSQEDNYYFIALLAVTLLLFSQLQDSFWLKSRIIKAKRKIEDELLERDIREQSGLIVDEKKDLLELEINVGSPDPWYKRPVGIITIGLLVVIVGRVITSILGVND